MKEMDLSNNNREQKMQAMAGHAPNLGAPPSSMHSAHLVNELLCIFRHNFREKVRTTLDHLGFVYNGRVSFSPTQLFALRRRGLRHNILTQGLTSD